MIHYVFVSKQKTIKDLNQLQNLVDFSKIHENHDILSNMNGKVGGKF